MRVSRMLTHLICDSALRWVHKTQTTSAASKPKLNPKPDSKTQTASAASNSLIAHLVCWLFLVGGVRKYATCWLVSSSMQSTAASRVREGGLTATLAGHILAISKADRLHIGCVVSSIRISLKQCS